MRLGVFGGTFDPVHYGHLLLAESARESASLDHIWFMPAGRPPHKLEQPLTPGEHRLEMLELAIAGFAAFGVSSLEVDEDRVSYTVDTLSRLKGEDPARELFFLMGADSLADLPNWREPARICQLATPLVVSRAESREPDFSVLAAFLPPDRVAAIRQARVEMPVIGFSSSELRARVAQGKSVRYRTPRAVEKYIETHGLYRTI